MLLLDAAVLILVGRSYLLSLVSAGHLESCLALLVETRRALALIIFMLVDLVSHRLHRTAHEKVSIPRLVTLTARFLPSEREVILTVVQDGRVAANVVILEVKIDLSIAGELLIADRIVSRLLLWRVLSLVEYHHECFLIAGTCACPEILLGGVGGFRVRFLFVTVLCCDDLLSYVLAMHTLLGNAGVKLVLLQLHCRIHVLYVERPRRTILALHGILLKVALIGTLVSGLD